MNLYISLLIICLVVAIGGLLLRKPLAGRFVIPFWALILSNAFILGIGFGAGGMYLYGYRWLEQKPEPYIPVSDRIRHPLLKGDRVLSFQAGGWLNGCPPKLEGAGEGLIVLDIWTEW